MWSRQPARKKTSSRCGKNWAPKVLFCISPHHVCVIKLKGGKKYLPSHDIHMVRYHGTTTPHKHTYREKTSLANAA